MSAVSNNVIPRSIALWITLREVSRSVRWPKLLQPRPTADTRRPGPPRLRICMDRSCGGDTRRADIVARVPLARKVRCYRDRRWAGMQEQEEYAQKDAPPVGRGDRPGTAWGA